MIEIRPETPDDFSAIRAVNEQAFGGTAEATLVEMLRAANKAIVSLVAVSDSRVVGHILFSLVTIVQAPEYFRGVGLAPMCVLPDFQNNGIGSTLVRNGLEECKRAGYHAVVVLGHTRYYPRFGFLRAKDHGLENEYGEQDAFMVLELQQGILHAVHGLVKYASEFKIAGC